LASLYKNVLSVNSLLNPFFPFTTFLFGFVFFPANVYGDDNFYPVIDTADALVPFPPLGDVDDFATFIISQFFFFAPCS